MLYMFFTNTMLYFFEIITNFYIHLFFGVFFYAKCHQNSTFQTRKSMFFQVFLMKMHEIFNKFDENAWNVINAFFWIQMKVSYFLLYSRVHISKTGGRVLLINTANESSRLELSFTYKISKIRLMVIEIELFENFKFSENPVF